MGDNAQDNAPVVDEVSEAPAAEKPTEAAADAKKLEEEEEKFEDSFEESVPNAASKKFEDEKFENDLEESVPTAGSQPEPAAEAVKQEEKVSEAKAEEAPTAVADPAPAAADPAPADPAPAAADPVPAPAAQQQPVVESAATVKVDEGYKVESAPAGDALDREMQQQSQQSKAGSRSQSPKQGNKSQTKSKINEHKELKARTQFANQTNDGVLQRTTFIHKLSTYRSAPEVAIASRGEPMFMRSSGGPAPGTYHLPDDHKTKFKSVTCASFGGSSRFGLGTGPTKLSPGPGQYHPQDPSMFLDTKVRFGTSMRNKRSMLHENPGPGAYEVRSTVGGGMMFTARGRQPANFMRARSMPGPGAYTPVPAGTGYSSGPKASFGSSVRGDIMFTATRNQPGPGAYEMQNTKCVGKDTPKYSATSRRRMHDLSSYTTPGPGTYNAHATSFGNVGAYSCRHVDDGYKSRNSPNTSQQLPGSA